MSAKKNKHKAPQKVAASPPQVNLESYASLDSKLGRVSLKLVQETLPKWSSYPPTITVPGAPPPERVGDLVQLQPLLVATPKTSELRQDVTGIRDGVLHESLYLLYKAWHVGSICTEHLLAGKLTWAEVEAYQSSLFGMNSVLGFLGITFPTQNHMLDVWPSPIKGQRAQSKDQRSDTVQLIKFQNLDHYHRWAILKRVLRGCEPNSFAAGIGNVIDGFDNTAFAARRNKVNYTSGYWTYQDLFVPFPDDTLGRASSEQLLLDSLRQNDRDFSFFLMLALLRLAQLMAHSVGELVGIVRMDIEQLTPHIRSVERIWPDGFHVPQQAGKL